MKDSRPPRGRPRRARRLRPPARAPLAALFLLVVPTARAQEAPKAGERRLTSRQSLKVLQTNRPKLERAYQLLQEGRPAEAIPVVNEIIALEREVLKEAASNPIDVRLEMGGSIAL